MPLYKHTTIGNLFVAELYNTAPYYKPTGISNSFLNVYNKPLQNTVLYS